MALQTVPFLLVLLPVECLAAKPLLVGPFSISGTAIRLSYYLQTLSGWSLTWCNSKPGCGSCISLSNVAAVEEVAEEHQVAGIHQHRGLNIIIGHLAGQAILQVCHVLGEYAYFIQLAISGWSFNRFCHPENILKNSPRKSSRKSSHPDNVPQSLGSHIGTPTKWNILRKYYIYWIRVLLTVLRRCLFSSTLWKLVWTIFREDFQTILGTKVYWMTSKEASHF